MLILVAILAGCAPDEDGQTPVHAPPAVVFETNTMLWNGTPLLRLDDLALQPGHFDEHGIVGELHGRAVEHREEIGLGGLDLTAPADARGRDIRAVARTLFAAGASQVTLFREGDTGKPVVLRPTDDDLVPVLLTLTDGGAELWRGRTKMPIADCDDRCSPGAIATATAMVADETGTSRILVTANDDAEVAWMVDVLDATRVAGVARFALVTDDRIRPFWPIDEPVPVEERLRGCGWIASSDTVPVIEHLVWPGCHRVVGLGLAGMCGPEDPCDKPCRVEQGDIVQSFEWSDEGQLVSYRFRTTAPIRLEERGTAEFVSGWPVRATVDGRPLVIAYDDDNRPIRWGDHRFEYDDGQAVRYTDPEGTTFKLEYDPWGRITAEAGPELFWTFRWEKRLPGAWLTETRTTELEWDDGVLVALQDADAPEGEGRIEVKRDDDGRVIGLVRDGEAEPSTVVRYECDAPEGVGDDQPSDEP